MTYRIPAITLWPLLFVSFIGRTQYALCVLFYFALFFSHLLTSFYIYTRSFDSHFIPLFPFTVSYDGGMFQLICIRIVCYY